MDEQLEGTSIKLAKSDKSFVKRLGHGNVSEGVRILIELARGRNLTREQLLAEAADRLAEEEARP
jgi:hypothetical protein